MKNCIVLLLFLFLFHSAFTQNNSGNSYSEDSLSAPKKSIIIKEIRVDSRMGKFNLLSGSTGILVNLDEINLLPNIVGDADPFISLRYLGGITQSGEGNSGLYVRGGNNDQNLILLNGSTIQNPTHVLGMFSIFNPDIVDKMRFVKSGIPAEYGGRLSSVVEVETVNNCVEKLTVDGSIGLISSRLSIKAPINPNLTAYSSFRGSYLNTLVMPALTMLGIDTILTQNRYQFSDANAGLIYQIAQKTKISSHLYYGNDNILIKEVPKFSMKDNSIIWNNKAFGVEINHRFSQEWSMNHALNYSGFNMGTNLVWSNSKINLKTSYKAYTYKSDFFHIKNQHNIKFGAELSSNLSNPHNVSADSLLPLELSDEHNMVRSVQMAAYLRDEFTVGSFEFNVGLRSSYHAHLGPFTDYLSESKHFYKNNELIKAYHGVEPRFFARYLISPTSSIKTSATKHYQYINQIPAINLGIPVDLLLPSGLHVEPQKSWHFSAGYFRNFSENKFEASTELYYKTLRNQLEFNNGLVETFSNIMIERNLLKGIGWAYGVETKFRMNENKFTGWISYNLAWNYRKFDGLNNGLPFLAKNDRRHDLSVVGIYQINRSWSISGLFVYATGNRLNLPLSWFIIDNKIVLEHGNYNAFEMPPFHRFDFSANYKLKPFKRVSSELNLSVYNLYNRANPYQVYYGTSKYEPNKNYNFKFGMSYLLPIIPTISWIFHFE